MDLKVFRTNSHNGIGEQLTMLWECWPMIFQHAVIQHCAVWPRQRSNVESLGLMFVFNLTCGDMISVGILQLARIALKNASVHEFAVLTTVKQAYDCSPLCPAKGKQGQHLCDMCAKCLFGT